MATRPTGPARWPISQEQRRVQTIELAKYATDLLQDARTKLDNRDHPAEIARDIADAMRYLSDIKVLMHEAKNGFDAETKL